MNPMQTVTWGRYRKKPVVIEAMQLVGTNAEIHITLRGHTCDWGNCGRWADSLRFDERLGVLVPVCWRHITAYRIGKGGTGLWQAEDEFVGLRFCRRARWRWLAQRRILADQRAAMAGRMSRAQARRWERADS